MDTRSEAVETPLRVFWKRFKRHRLALVSAFILIILGAAAIGATYVAPYHPNEINLDHLPSPGVPASPSWQHLFGTDSMGRDYFSRAIYGARISLSVGFVAVSISISIGVFVGALAGYLGGKTDEVLMRVVDFVLTFPTFFLILTIQSILTPSIYNVMIVIGLTGWASIARVVRGEVLSVKNKDFVEAARAMGNSDLKIIVRHILPHTTAVIVVAATLGIPGAILTESALSFLGLGVQPPTASWGNMLQNANVYMRIAWWMSFFPGVLISITVLAFNFVGDGLRDALDPKQLQKKA